MIREEERVEKHFTIKQANGLFVIIALVFLTLGAYVQSRSIIWGLLITEYFILLLPVLLFAFIKKINIRAAFRLKRLPLKVIFRIILLSLLLIPTVALVNLIAVFIIELFSSSITTPLPNATSGMDFIILFFVIAVSAGLCEEFFFRGMVLDAYQSESNLLTAAIWSAILFGIFHFNPQNLFGPIVLGLMYAYLVQLTGSIWAGVIGHITNNGIAVSMGYLLTFFSDIGMDAAESEAVFDNIPVLLGVIFFYLILALVSFIGVKTLIGGIKSLYPRYEIGDRVKVKGKVYIIQEKNQDELVLKAEMGDEQRLVTTIDRVVGVGGKSDYALWSGQKLKWDFHTVASLSVAGVFYGLIIYYGYIKGIA